MYIQGRQRVKYANYTHYSTHMYTYAYLPVPFPWECIVPMCVSPNPGALFWRFDGLQATPECLDSGARFPKIPDVCRLLSFAFV